MAEASGPKSGPILNQSSICKPPVSLLRIAQADYLRQPLDVTMFTAAHDAHVRHLLLLNYSCYLRDESNTDIQPLLNNDIQNPSKIYRKNKPS